MSKPELTLRVWSPEEGDVEPTEPNGHGDPPMAALEYGEREYDLSGYPDEQRISVKDSSGVITWWTIVAERTVEFSARRYQDSEEDAVSEDEDIPF